LYKSRISPTQLERNLSDLRHELSTRFIDRHVEAIGRRALSSAVIPDAKQ
jgi:hypothetical protein